jgi:paraquat-inducible protein A
MTQRLSLIACPYCDLVQREVRPPERGSARCCRCESVLYSARPDSAERTLAFTLAAAVLLLIANAFPILELEVQGQRHASTLLGAVRALWDQEVRSVAALVCVTTIVFPAIEVACMIYMLAPLRAGRIAPGVPRLLRLVQAIRPWGMVEVFILGVLVSLVKLAHLATIHTDTALWAFGALMMTLAAAAMSFDPRAVWSRMELVR